MKWNRWDEFISVHTLRDTAQTFGLESKYLKYNLDNSASDYMWCWMSDSLKYYDNIFNKMKHASKRR